MVKKNGIGCGFSIIKNDSRRTNFDFLMVKNQHWILIQSNGSSLMGKHCLILHKSRASTTKQKKESLVWKVLEKW
jgi:hypothetical protein